MVKHDIEPFVAVKKGDEYWKYTSPVGFEAGGADADVGVATPDNTDFFANFDCIRIVFSDGVFYSGLSDKILAQAGIKIESLHNVLDEKDHWSKELYGTIEAESQNPVPRPFARLNTATAKQGAVIHISKTPPKPIAILYKNTGATANPMLHHFVKLDDGVTLTLLESGSAGNRANIVTELDISDGATLHHIRADGINQANATLTSGFARLGANSQYRAFHFGKNTRMVRNEMVVIMTGEGAQVTLAAAYIGNGGAHNDDTVLVIHKAPHCQSRQVFKKVLRNGAVGVFQGKILVEQPAQKTDGYQIGQALMLDGDSVFLVKPELEIYADDVVCSHGSTVGAIEEDALFYLVSRGIRRAEAQDILAFAFLAEAVEEVADADIAEAVRAALVVSD